MKIEFLRAAQTDLDAAFVWYEEQAIGLGYEFLDEIDQTIRLLSTFPRFSSEVAEGIRRSLVNRFPYGIFYAIASDRIVIVAIAHLKRAPDFWQGKPD